MYSSVLNLFDTQVAIKLIKDNFENKLAKKLNLTRVSAPLFVMKSSGLNDYLNGHERPVTFDALSFNDDIEIVQSLAKWKRCALARYNFAVGSGLYTDMNAIRRDEVLDAIHSMYVDQWDWEKIINKPQRRLCYLKKEVRNIYSVILSIAKEVNKAYPVATEYTEDGQIEMWNIKMLFPALLKIVQDQQKKIEALEEQINNKAVN